LVAQLIAFARDVLVAADAIDSMDGEEM